MMKKMVTMNFKTIMKKKTASPLFWINKNNFSNYKEWIYYIFKHIYTLRILTNYNINAIEFQFNFASIFNAKHDTKT